MSLAERLYPDEFYRDADLRLVQAVPPEAIDILDAESKSGALAEVLRHLVPARRIIGVTTDTSADVAGFSRIVDRSAIERLAPASLDAVIVGERTLAHPTWLDAIRPLLRPHGKLVAALPNAQHWTQLDRLLRGEAPLGVTAPQLMRSLLDAGFLPRIADRRLHPLPDAWLTALPALAESKQLGLKSCLARSQTLSFIVSAPPLPDLPEGSIPPVSIGVCCNNADVLADNLLASPDLQAGPHEVITVEGATSFAAGFEAVLAQAHHDLVVLVHQDIYLPRGWFARLWHQYALARQQTGDRVGVMGVYGVRGTEQGILRAGRVADRDALLDESTPLPALVSSLDEIVLAVPRGTPLRIDPALGFHLYGTDLALSAEKAGLAALAIDAPCHHNSQLGDELPAAFHAATLALRAKWPLKQLIATPCMLISAGPY